MPSQIISKVFARNTTITESSNRLWRILTVCMYMAPSIRSPVDWSSASCLMPSDFAQGGQTLFPSVTKRMSSSILGSIKPLQLRCFWYTRHRSLRVISTACSIGPLSGVFKMIPSPHCQLPPDSGRRSIDQAVGISLSGEMGIPLTHRLVQ